MTHRFQRAHFRVHYPIQGRPRLTLDPDVDTEYEVLDCSERGVRFRHAGEPPELGTEVSGRVRFRSGAEVVVEGTVIRVHASDVALHLTQKPIPLGAIYSEQRFLRSRFPLWVEEWSQLPM
jgi:hypothetical protein